MKCGDKEFDEMQENFERCLANDHYIYVSGKVEREKPGEDGKVPGGRFYTNGEISKLFHAFMLGYSFRTWKHNMGEEHV